KLDVLHQCQWRKSAHPQKISAPHENALIAVNCAEYAAVPALEPFQKTEARMALVKPAIKCATHCITRIKRAQSRHVARRKLRVYMMKNQPIGGGNLCALIQLQSAIRLRILDENRAEQLNAFT